MRGDSSSYVATYLERDINELISTDNITFTKFLTSVAARTGEMIKAHQEKMKSESKYGRHKSGIR